MFTVNPNGFYALLIKKIKFKQETRLSNFLAVTHNNINVINVH